nr:DUF4097 family beta strand repeat-containing protein [Cohnella kolymensis]
MDVSFVKSGNGTNSVLLQGKGTPKMIEDTTKTEISEQSLQLALTREGRGFNLFNFNLSDSTQHLTISVTDDAVWEKLNLELDSGNVRVNDAAVTKLLDAKITVDSGNISIKNFKSEQLNFQVDSGNVTAEDVQANLTGATDSGNIQIRNFAGDSKLSVDSGNIKLYKQDIGETDLSADSGNVYVQMPSSFAGFYDLQADSGSVRAPDSKRETNDYVKVRTDSGNITVEQK